MASQSSYSYTVAALVLLASILVLRRRQAANRQQQAAEPKPHQLAALRPEQLPENIQSLRAELPGCVILQTDVAAFQQAVDHSWAQQVREIVPACFVRPRDAQQLSKAVAILKREYDTRRSSQAGTPVKAFFTVRSGGANPGLGAATVQHGIVIDLSLFREVTPAADGATVTIGTGARWVDVYTALDEKGLVVIGGRNSPVGVGGLTLQGKICHPSLDCLRHEFQILQ
jgi:FAD/FMN-containing dehydrogenase